LYLNYIVFTSEKLEVLEPSPKESLTHSHIAFFNGLFEWKNVLMDKRKLKKQTKALYNPVNETCITCSRRNPKFPLFHIA